MNETKPPTAVALIAYVDSHINQVTPETAWSTETVKQLRDALETLIQQNQQAREIFSRIDEVACQGHFRSVDLLRLIDAKYDAIRAWLAANPKRKP